MFDTRISFSVLVPVYNAEKFLSECIESALNQTYKNFEVILVDDGSTDTSGAICDQYTAAHENVLTFHTENGGQIRAREFAMKHAKGDYFVFLDADDRLRCNALETIAKTIHKHQCDCVIFGLVKIIGGAIVPEPDEEIEEVLSNRRDIYRKCLNGNNGTKYNAIWRKAARATVWSQTVMDKDVHEIRLGEDLIQSLTVFKNSARIAFIKDALYEYRENPNGISSTFSYDAYVKSMGVNEIVYRFLQGEQVYSEQDFEEFRHACAEKHVMEMLRICQLEIPVAEKIQLMQKLRKSDYFCEFVNHGRANMLPYKRRVLFLLSRWKMNYGIVFLEKIYKKVIRLRQKNK